MIRLFYDGFQLFQARVLHDDDMTEPFSMSTGVHQGCLLSPLLFLVALDWVFCQALGDNETGIQFTLLRKLYDLDFEDDMVLLSQKIAHMRQKFEAPQEQAARVGLKVNPAKTKEMRIRSLANTGTISYGGESLEKVTAFTYLSSLITTTGSTEDVEARCRKAQAAFAVLRPIWRSRVHLSADKEKDLRFQREVGSALWVRDLKTIIAQL